MIDINATITTDLIARLTLSNKRIDRLEEALRTVLGMSFSITNVFTECIE